MMKTSLLLAACGALATGGCFADDGTDLPTAASSQQASESSSMYLDQGWSDEVRNGFYSLTQGSRMLPYEWFLVLEQADRKKPFRAQSNLRRMGFLPDSSNPYNPDKLPVGLAKDVDMVRGNSVGLTCAGCHTGEIEYEGVKVRIDGGQSLVDIEQFQNGILASLSATLDDSKKWSRFSAGVLGAGATAADDAALLGEVEAQRDKWTGRIARSAGLSAHGPGRTDAFSIIVNEVACDFLGVASNCDGRPAVAPTQYPHLWDTPDFQWVQYNSSVHSPLGRNVGEVTGVFAEMQLMSNGAGGYTIDSTANIENLTQLENWLKDLRSPAWPEEVLGAIDADLAAEGDVLYAAKCEGCHTEDPSLRSAPNAYGKTFALTNFQTPLHPGYAFPGYTGPLLGTDPTAAFSFATRRVDPGPLTPVAAYLGLLGPDGKMPAPKLLGLTGGMIIQKFFADNGLSGLAALAYLDFRESLDPSTPQLLTYKARPLNGVAFTAPFLHNGSVPNMYELLSPASERSAQFYVGSAKYDVENMGYETGPASRAVLLDTTQLGNSNAGHEFGTDMTHDERMAVIEYIKTL